MNKVNLLGTFTKEFEYSHTTNGTQFWKSSLRVPRHSGYEDVITIVTANPEKSVRTGNWYVDGELRVFNCHGHSHFYVYTNYIYSVDEPPINIIELEGRLIDVKQPRKTPRGKIIRDSMLEVIRENGKKDNIPVIFWNTLAEKELSAMSEINVRGRLQSREYEKNGIHTAIEVSVNEIL